MEKQPLGKSGPGLTRPPYLRARVSQSFSTAPVQEILTRYRLSTVCQEAHCPNICECYGAGTATFLIMGDTCTRCCGFCAVRSGKPLPLDPTEPERVAQAVSALGLKYVVITSVDRDDLTDGGAGHFSQTIARVRARAPSCAVEVLTGDFRGSTEALETVFRARPAVFGYNLETVKRLYPEVRPGATYHRSLEVLRYAASRKEHYGFALKSGFMLGLGEGPGDIQATLRDLASCRCDIVTIGQYLAPSDRHLPVRRFIPPEQFRTWQEKGERLGIPCVYAGPLVRSSYHAEQQAARMKAPRSRSTPPRPSRSE